MRRARSRVARVGRGALVGMVLAAVGLGAWASAEGAAGRTAGRAAGGRRAVVVAPRGDGPVAFAADEVAGALRGRGWAVVRADSAEGADAADGAARWAGADLVVRFEVGAPAPADLGPQGYAWRRSGTQIRVLAPEPVGAMYGGLDLAETIRLEGPGAVRDRQRRPAIARRGVKFNIPLDARTPSYDDSGDAAQKNIATVWEWDFWSAYLDEMARAHYNVLTLWNPHPFPSLVRVPEYPDLALEDVCVSRLYPTWKPGSFAEPQGVPPEVLRPENLRVVKRMTIDQKIAFWRRVMRRARQRGIEVYLITWNILTNSATGKHGITNAQDNPKTIAYIRASVRETVLTYPDLTGIGVTAGERMRHRDDEFSKEKWLWKAYGLGVLDAKRRQPGRTVRFIHRVWQTDLGPILREWSAYPDPFEVSFKYARARLYSSTRPPFSRALEEELRRRGLRSWWNLRNDDIFVFRWGDPDYVREFLGNLPADVTAGYYVGSDGYVWGREFISTEPEAPRRLEVRKHWYRFTLWGRLGYDPSLGRAHWEKVIAGRLPGAPAGVLYEAWQAASRIIPLVNRFHWRNWDFMWAVEGCMDQRKGFHTVRDFIDNPTMEASGLVSIRGYVRARTGAEGGKGGAAEGTTPPEVAERLDAFARAALEGVSAVRARASGPTKDLRRTLGDIEALAHLGRYYAAKIRGATELALFDATGQADHRRRAVGHLERAVDHWSAYARVATAQYRPQLLARTRVLDWNALLAEVERDVAIARGAGAKQGPRP